MNEKTNGAPVLDEGLPSIENDRAVPIHPEIAAAQLAKIVDEQVARVMGIMVRGILVSSPGVPPNIILPSIARSCGKMLAMSVAGNAVEQTVRARTDMKNAFEDGMKKVPLLQMAGAAPQG